MENNGKWKQTEQTRNENWYVNSPMNSLHYNIVNSTSYTHTHLMYWSANTAEWWQILHDGYCRLEFHRSNMSESFVLLRSPAPPGGKGWGRKIKIICGDHIHYWARGFFLCTVIFIQTLYEIVRHSAWSLCPTTSPPPPSPHPRARSWTLDVFPDGNSDVQCVTIGIPYNIEWIRIQYVINILQQKWNIFNDDPSGETECRKN